jgi:hypothetical protein
MSCTRRSAGFLFFAETIHSHRKPQERRSRETRYVCIADLRSLRLYLFIAIIQAAMASGSPVLVA